MPERHVGSPRLAGTTGATSIVLLLLAEAETVGNVG